MTREKSKLPFILLGLLGLAFLMMGVFAATIQAKRVLQEAGTIRSLPELNAQALENTSPGTTVVITGILERNDEIADVGGLIIYIEEIWRVHYNDSEGSEGWEGSWNKLNVMVPACNITFNGGNVLIQAGQGVIIDKPLYEYKLNVPREGHVVDGIKEGSMRRRGFKAGDQITVVGGKEPSGVIPVRIFGGDRAELEQYLAYQVSGLRITGTIFGLVGLGLILVSVVFLIRRPRQIQTELQSNR